MRPFLPTCCEAGLGGTGGVEGIPPPPAECRLPPINVLLVDDPGGQQGGVVARLISHGFGGIDDISCVCFQFILRYLVYDYYMQ